MHGLDVTQFLQPIGFAPGGEVGRRARIGAPRVGVANVGGEEFDVPPGGVRRRCKQRRKVGDTRFSLDQFLRQSRLLINYSLITSLYQ
jgi:hypothetical protein